MRRLVLCISLGGIEPFCKPVEVNRGNEGISVDIISSCSHLGLICMRMKQDYACSDGKIVLDAGSVRGTSTHTASDFIAACRMSVTIVWYLRVAHGDSRCMCCSR